MAAGVWNYDTDLPRLIRESLLRERWCCIQQTHDDYVAGLSGVFLVLRKEQIEVFCMMKQDSDADLHNFYTRDTPSHLDDIKVLLSGNATICKLRALS